MGGRQGVGYREGHREVHGVIRKLLEELQGSVESSRGGSPLAVSRPAAGFRGLLPKSADSGHTPTTRLLLPVLNLSQNPS